ncbi:MAG TPA: OmpA family protein [Nevskiaceae bacterium]|nr:OmpA family protein [Nevskiaceae bacterium]
MKTSLKISIAGFVIGSLLAGCADDPNRDTERGAAIGALAGAIIGNQSHSSKGKYVGAIIGGLAGAGVGHYMDKQRQDLEAKLKAEEQAKMLEITKLSDDSLKIGIASDASFDVGSAQLKPEALMTYGKIAQILTSYDQTVIHIVGHTDATGSDQLNQSLSESRAASVATYMESTGLSAQRIRTEGRGKREPIASNDTADGRSKNRRVDIVLKAIVQGHEQDAWTPPPYLGS